MKRSSGLSMPVERACRKPSSPKLNSSGRSGGDRNRRRLAALRPDLPREPRGDQRNRTAGEKSQLIAVHVVVDKPAARRHQGRAELMREEYPAIDARDRALAERVGGERDYRRDRPEPVEAADNREQKISRVVRNEWQEEERQSAQREDEREPFARLDAVDHPAREHRADEVEPDRKSVV